MQESKICTFCDKEHSKPTEYQGLNAYGAYGLDRIYFCPECVDLLPKYEQMRNQFAKDWTAHEPKYSYTVEQLMGLDSKTARCKMCGELLQLGEDFRLDSADNHTTYFYLGGMCAKKYLKKLQEQIEYFIDDNKKEHND